MSNSLLRLPAVVERTGLSRASVYLHVHKGVMTPPVKIGDRSAAWPEAEIDAINAARIAGKSELEIQVLVGSLQRQRSAA
ncbi:helix-turn-helix transcriptional regulator [Sphingomonas sp.]|jgi:prophage regulatory protein|uniref:helix-turn-helix transcriptional regulator n=1 Tax=Sphingomonas sp. TaxID=28214 RepID=UPI002D7EDA68|nr:AlpA family phage regulatory protein [Sphingomonas sp.]HEU0044211.1 AlpA family phage regulatory protein [Sphingomonas sp.]